MIVAHEIAELSGIKGPDQIQLEYAAGTHDADKRIKREGNKLAEERTATGTIIQFDAVKEALAEQAKKGLPRVTGSDLRDSNTWGLSEMALRYTDSLLIPVPGTPHTDIVHWRERIDELRQRHVKPNQEEGKIYGEEGKEKTQWMQRIADLKKRRPDANIGKVDGKDYDGILFYDVLELKMEEIEPILHERAMQVHPELKQKYPKSENYFQLMMDRITQKIEKTPLKPPKAA